MTGNKGLSGKGGLLKSPEFDYKYKTNMHRASDLSDSKSTEVFCYTFQGQLFELYLEFGGHNAFSVTVAEKREAAFLPDGFLCGQQQIGSLSPVSGPLCTARCTDPSCHVHSVVERVPSRGAQRHPLKHLHLKSQLAKLSVMKFKRKKKSNCQIVNLKAASS